MSVLAVIDDRADMRISMVRALGGLLKPLSWEIVDTGPLCTVEDYPHWLLEHDVSVLLLDERLNEKAPEVRYRGSDAARRVRSEMPYFPVFMVTAHSGDDSVRLSQGVVEDVISRKELLSKDKIGHYVDRFKRIGEARQKERNSILEELSRVAERVALGTATADEKSRLRELQLRYQQRLPDSASLSRVDLLEGFERVLKDAEALQKKINAKLKRK